MASDLGCAASLDDRLVGGKFFVFAEFAEACLRMLASQIDLDVLFLEP